MFVVVVVVFFCGATEEEEEEEEEEEGGAPFTRTEFSSPERPVVAPANAAESDLAAVVRVGHDERVVHEAARLQRGDHAADGVVEVVGHRAHRASRLRLHLREFGHVPAARARAGVWTSGVHGACPQVPGAHAYE